MTDMKSIPAMSFKRTCALNAISSESALIHFVLGKFCLHENLMPVWNLVAMTDMKSTPFWVSFGLNSQIKSWLNTEVRFSTKWNLIAVWIHFASHVNLVLIQHAEAVVQRCSVRWCPYKIRKIHRKTPVLETLAQMFSCEFCKIYKNTFCYRTPPVAASEHPRFHLRPTVSYFSCRFVANNNAILMLICF